MPSESPASPESSLYVILGAAVRGLYDLGTDPQEIIKGITIALESISRESPAVVAAARSFAESVIADLDR